MSALNFKYKLDSPVGVTEPLVEQEIIFDIKHGSCQGHHACTGASVNGGSIGEIKCVASNGYITYIGTSITIAIIIWFLCWR